MIAFLSLEFEQMIQINMEHKKHTFNHQIELLVEAFNLNLEHVNRDVQFYDPHPDDIKLNIFAFNNNHNFCLLQFHSICCS